MKRRIARAITRIIVERPYHVGLLFVVITVFSFLRASQLYINHNQIELIPQHLKAVVATNEMLKMVNSVGFLLMPLKGKKEDLDHTKRVADELAERLGVLPEVRKVTYKQDVGFVIDRLPLFIETADLKEGYKRIRKKIRAILAKNNPFYIQLTDRKPEEINFDDLIDKYRRMNKKAIDDPYYVDKTYESVLLVIKPSGVNTDLDFMRQLLREVERVVTEYNAENTHGAKLVEHYGGFAPDATITYGYTGSFKRNLDDSDTMKAAIIPTAGFAFIGILIYLGFVLRRASQVVVIMLVLGAVVTMSFAFCEIVVGELNSITAILAAILMGLGIDYGIHFMYRFREEFTRRGDLTEAIAQTLEHSGSASLGAATTTASTLYILTLSDFKGFSDFGLVTGTGVLYVFVVMYTAIPTIYVLIDRIWPNFKNSLRVKEKSADYEKLRSRPYPYAKQILLGTLGLTLILAVFAINIEFNYDSRALMAVDRPSVVLQEEIGKRWGTSSDPVGIYTDTLEEAEALFKHLTPVPEESNIDTVISLFTLVPEQEQQQANLEILAKLKKKVEPITKDMIEDEKARDNYDFFMKLLDVKAFGMEDVPWEIESQFRPIKTSPYKGYLTYIYPKTSLWDGQELVAFANEVGTITVNGNEYHAAGITVIFAQLAQIVLRDGKLFTLLAGFVIFFIAWADFRSIVGALLAMLPLIAGLVWMLGFMTIFNWQVNFMNIVVFPLVFGYGISAGVHLYHRYQESGSVMIAVRRTGGAVAASSVTTLVGWAAMVVSGHRGLTSMGILACFGIASTLLVSLTVLPALLQVWQDRGGGAASRSESTGAAA